MLFCSYYRHHLNQVVTPYLNTPRFLLCRICAIATYNRIDFARVPGEMPG